MRKHQVCRRRNRGRVTHIHPLSLSGQTDFENFCLACPACNRHKANRVIGLTDERAESRLFHPERDYRHLLAQESATDYTASGQDMSIVK